MYCMHIKMYDFELATEIEGLKRDLVGAAGGRWRQSSSTV
jgi:hypothetical protein